MNVVRLLGHIHKAQDLVLAFANNMRRIVSSVFYSLLYSITLSSRTKYHQMLKPILFYSLNNPMRDIRQYCICGDISLSLVFHSQILRNLVSMPSFHATCEDVSSHTIF